MGKPGDSANRVDHELAAAVMLDHAWGAHFTAQKDDGRSDFTLREYAAKPLVIVATILQAQDHRFVANIRPDLVTRTFGIARFHAEEHELRSFNGGGITIRLDAYVFIEGLGVHVQPVAGDCLNVLRTCDERHVVPGTGEHAAEIAADRTGTHHRNLEPGIRHTGFWHQ